MKNPQVSTEDPAFEEAEKEVREQIERLFSIAGDKTVDHFHRELGRVMWQECAMSRNRAGLENAIAQIRQIREDFWKEVRVPGKANGLNTELEKALRRADFIELALLM
jgi:succinate dehydrogenase / fumarate reductase flavoprotein subunit